MIKLTDFNSAVDTYKKNFLIRKKRFGLLKKQTQQESRKKREKKIETSKFMGNLDKFVPKSLKQKGSNLVDVALKFGFAIFIGSLLQNLSGIINTVKDIYKKIADIVKGTKEFVSGVLGGLRSFYEGASENIEKLNKLVSDIKTEAEKYGEIEILGVKLKEIVDGIVTIAGVLASVQFFKDVLGFLKPKSTPDVGGSAGAASRIKDKVRKRVKRRVPVTTPVTTPLKQLSPIRTPVGAGVRSGGFFGGLKRTFDFISGADDNLFKNLSSEGASAATSAKKQSGLKLAEDIAKAKKSYSRINQSGTPLFSSNMLEMEVRNASNPYSTRKAAYDVLVERGTAYNVEAPRSTDISYKTVIGEVDKTSPQERIRLQEEGVEIAKKPGPAKRVAGFILKRLNGLAKLLKWVALALLVSELTIDYLKEDYNAMTVKLFAFGLSGLAVFLANAAGLKLAAVTGGAGLPATLAIGAGSLGIGVAVDMGIRNFFLGKDFSNKKLPLVKGANIIPVDEKELDKRYGIDRSYRDTAPVPIPGTSKQPVDPKKPPGVPYSDQEYMYPDGSTLKPGDIVGSVNNINGLDGATTYGSDRGMMISREVVIAIQPVEVPV